MLAVVLFEPPEDVGRTVLLEHYGRGQTQEVIPVVADQPYIDGLIGADHPAFRRLAKRLSRPPMLPGLLMETLTLAASTNLGNREIQMYGRSSQRRD